MVIARGDFFLFAPKGGDFSRVAAILNIHFRGMSYPKYFYHYLISRGVSMISCNDVIQVGGFEYSKEARGRRWGYYSREAIKFQIFPPKGGHNPRTTINQGVVIIPMNMALTCFIVLCCITGVYVLQL